MEVRIAVRTLAQSSPGMGRVVFLTSEKPRPLAVGSSWQPDLVASETLRRRFLAGELSSKRFRRRYIGAVGRRTNMERLSKIRLLARAGPITFVTDMPEPERSDAAILAKLLGDGEIRRGRWKPCYVYAIELRGRSSTGRSEVYVGMTCRSPEERFIAETGQGFQAVRVVRERGTRLAYELFAHRNPLEDRCAACSAERALAADLEAGFDVHWGACGDC